MIIDLEFDCRNWWTLEISNMCLIIKVCTEKDILGIRYNKKIMYQMSDQFYTLFYSEYHNVYLFFIIRVKII